MKIVYITHYTELYGANKSLLDLLEGMSTQKNIDIHLVVPATGRITDIATQKNIKYSVIPFYNEIHFGDYSEMSLIGRSIELGKGCAKFLYNWLTVFKHSSIFKGCDIIHINSTATLIGAYFAYWLSKKLIWHVREFGWEDYKIKYNFGYKYFQYWLKKADVVISISKAIYEKRVLSCNVKESTIIHNGIISRKDLQQHKQQRLSSDNNKHAQGDVTFAIVGLISPEKGQADAISSFTALSRTHSNIKLLIVGNGPTDYVAGLKNYVKEHHLEERVIFTGYLEKVEEIYKSIDCLLMCSRHEALGRVTIEAMSFGVPVIGYNGGGTIEIIKDGYNGLLYSEGDNALYEKMSLYMQGGLLSENYVKNAFETVEEYTIEKCTDSVYDIYASYGA